MAAVLVTLAEAKDHLQITLPPGDPGDADLQAKLDEAEAIIRAYVTDDASWDATTVPPPIRSAIKLQLGYLFDQRGSDAERITYADLWNHIRLMLQAYHVPAFS